MDEFIKTFYEKMGKHYLEPHEKGLRDLLGTVRGLLSSYLDRKEKADRVFSGECIATPRPPKE